MKARDEPEEKREVKKVISGDIQKQKKPLGTRFMETFIGGDSRSVWTSVAQDVLIPAAKDMVSDAVSQGIERMLFGDSRRSRGSRPSDRGGYTSYNRMSDSRRPLRDEPRRESTVRARSRVNFDEYVLESRAEADTVLDEMSMMLDKYAVVSIADFYNLIGVTADYTDEKYGWTDLHSADVIRRRRGWVLDLPAPTEI